MKQTGFLESIETYKIIFENLPLHVIITDTEGSIIAANKKAEEITGFSTKEMLGNTPRLWGGQMNPSFYKEFWQTIKEERKVYVGLIKNKRKNGAFYYAALKAAPIIDENNELQGFCGIEQDITELRELSDKFDAKERYEANLRNLIRFQ